MIVSTVISCTQIDFEANIGDTTKKTRTDATGSTTPYSLSATPGKYSVMVTFTNASSFVINLEENIVGPTGQIIWGQLKDNYFDVNGLNLHISGLILFTCADIDTANNIICSAANVTLDGILYTTMELKFTRISTTSSVPSTTLFTLSSLSADGLNTDWMADGAPQYDDKFSDSMPSGSTGVEINSINFSKPTTGGFSLGVNFYISFKDSINNSVNYRIILSNDTYNSIQIDITHNGSNWVFYRKLNNGSSTPVTLVVNDLSLSPTALEFTTTLDELVGVALGAAVPSKFANMMLKVETRAKVGDTTYDVFIPKTLFSY